MSSPVTTIAEIGKHEGQSVIIRGWLYNLRESGKLLFPQFRDGSGIIQGVVPKNAVPAQVFDALKGLTQESSVIVEGKVRADKRAPGGYELDVSNVEVLQRVPEHEPFPISLKEHGLDFLMEQAENFISFIVRRCLDKRPADLKTVGRDISHLEKITAPFPRVSYADAVRMLQEAHAKSALENKFEYGGDFGSPDETYLSAQF